MSARDRTRAGPRKHAIRGLGLALASLVVPAALAGQQFGTDDAAIVGYRACQLEAWYGETETRVEPACQVIRNLEVTAGFAWLRENGGTSVEYLLETKLALLEPDDNALGLALLVGAEFARQRAGGAAGVAALYALIPASIGIGADRLTLHGNLGGKYERDEHEHDGERHGERHLVSLWAARGDLLLPFVGERLTLVSEVFGTGRDSPEFQVGVRASVIPERLLVDLSWGGHTAADTRGAGWVIGIGWTPPPLF
jgi:hypothetical protein